MGELAPGVPPQGAKTCFVFFLLSMQRGLSATYPAPISTIFETTDVNRFPYAYTGGKFFQFQHRGFSKSQNSPKYGTVWYKPTTKPTFWRLYYLSWPNRIYVGININRNRLPLGNLLYCYNRQQLITTMSTRERLQRDRATPEINCWDEVRRFNVTHKGAARSLRAYIAVCPQTHCNPSSLLLWCKMCLKKDNGILIHWRTVV